MEVWKSEIPGPGQISENLEIWGPGHPEIWKLKNHEKTNVKIGIRSAQNVGKVWISRQKSSWPHLVPFQAIFSVDQKHKNAKKTYFPWWANGPYSPGLGSCAGGINYFLMDLLRHGMSMR